MKDFRLKKDIIKEDSFICKLRSNKTLYYLANKILFGYIKCSLENGFSKKDIINIIKIEILSKNTQKQKGYSRVSMPEYKEKTPLFLKNGYDCDNYDCNSLFNFKNYKELAKYNLKHKIELLQITSAFYKFQMNNILFTKIYKNDPIIKKKIVSAFNTYFLTDYNFKQINDIVNKSEGHWFYTWLLVFLESDVKNLMHRNSNEDKDYIREWVKNITMDDINKKSQKNINCIKDEYKYNYDIVIGNTFMKPINNGIFWNVMKQNNKEIFAGFSSSAVLCYNSIFNVTHILKKNKKNKVLLLCLILADYYGIHHSISEVLGFYTVEAEFNDYKLKNNDINYIKNKITKYVPNLFNI